MYDGEEWNLWSEIGLISMYHTYNVYIMANVYPAATVHQN